MSTNSSLIVLVYPDLTRYELRRGKIRMEHHLPSPGLSGMKIFYSWQSDVSCKPPRDRLPHPACPRSMQTVNWYAVRKLDFFRCGAFSPLRSTGAALREA